MKLTLYARVGTRHVRVTKERNKYVPVLGATYYEIRRRQPDTGKPAWQNLGRDFTKAVVTFINEESKQGLRDQGEDVPPARRGSIGKTLSLAIEEFLEDKRNMAPGTPLQYKNTLAKFRESCTKTYVDQIDRRDFIKFDKDMAMEGLSPRTRHDRQRTVCGLLKFAGKEFAEGEEPTITKPPDNPVDAYSKEQLQALFNATKTARDEIVLQCFAFSGVRDGELKTLRWMDIRPTGFLIRTRADWRTKTPESSRWVPVPSWLLEKLAAWKTPSIAPNALVFPDRSGGTDEHFLRIAKDAAKFLHWDVQSSSNPDGVRVDIHKFRSTAITMWLQDGKPEREVKRWIGHTAKSTTIARYYKHMEDDKAQAVAASTFAEFAPKPQLVPTQKRAVGGD